MKVFLNGVVFVGVGMVVGLVGVKWVIVVGVVVDGDGGFVLVDDVLVVVVLDVLSIDSRLEIGFVIFVG